MQLRSGQLKNPPTRTCISAYSVFYHDKAAEMRKDGKKYTTGDFQSIISEQWKNLSEDDKEDFEEKFQKQEQKYKEELILYYGGSQSDLKKFKSLLDIPPKPKKPVSGCFAYIIENRHAFSEANPKLKAQEVTKELADKYNSLSAKEKKKYEDNHEKLYNQYLKEHEEWAKKYQTKQDQFNTLIEEKFKRTPSKVDLDYQELPPYKRQPKKLIDNEETEQAQKKAEKDKNAKNEGKGKGNKNDKNDKEDKKDRRKSAGKK